MSSESEMVAAGIESKPTYNGPPLPESIISQVIAYHAAEPWRVAQYLRVSHTFHLAVVPHLYKVLRLPMRQCHHPDSWKEPGYGCPRHSENPLVVAPLADRISPTPLQNMHFSQGVVLGAHSPSDCKHVMHHSDAATEHLKPSWVRFQVGWDDKTHNYPETFSDLRESCPFVEQLCPKKLILSNTNLIQPFPLHQRIPRSVKTLVAVMTSIGDPPEMGSEDEDEEEYEDLTEWSDDEVAGEGDSDDDRSISSISHWRRPVRKIRDPFKYLDDILLDSLTSVQHLVYICQPANCFSRRWHQEVDGLHKIANNFCTHLFETVKRVRPQKVTIVDPQIVNGCQTWSEPDEELVQLDKMIKQAWRSLKPKPKTAGDEERPVELEVMGMSDYLQRYNWTGDFDRASVSSWLDEDVRQRLRAESEERWRRGSSARRREQERRDEELEREMSESTASLMSDLADVDKGTGKVRRRQTTAQGDGADFSTGRTNTTRKKKKNGRDSSGM